jgi:hypothetical protein
MKDSKVYICNYAGYDYSPARTYGRLTKITEGTVNVFKVERLAHDIKKALRSFRSDKDYLLFGGNIVINVLAVTEILSRSDKVKCLLYGAKRNDYVEIDIKSEWPDIDEESEWDQPLLSSHEFGVDDD